MNDCKHEEEMSALLDGELSPDQEREIKAHLEGCQACRQTLERWQRLDWAAGAIGEPIPSQWDEMWAKVEKAAAQKRAAVRLRREITRGVWVAAAAAAVLLAAFFLSPTKPLLTTPGSSSKAAPFEVVKLEVSPDYTAVVMSGQDKDLPVIWLERM